MLLFQKVVERPSRCVMPPQRIHELNDGSALRTDWRIVANGCSQSAIGLAAIGDEVEMQQPGFNHLGDPLLWQFDTRCFLPVWIARMFCTLASVAQTLLGSTVELCSRGIGRCGRKTSITVDSPGCKRTTASSCSSGAPSNLEMAKDSAAFVNPKARVFLKTCKESALPSPEPFRRPNRS